MHVAIITAGGAGMFCGSCMHDNTWARALLAAGIEASLVPTYTPIRLDEPDQSERQVYLGGLNVYLGSRLPLWSRLPRWATHWLDRPQLIQWATKFSVSNDAARLGRLTLDMLAGESGPHRSAGEELARHIADELRPDVVIFSNALLVGTLRTLRSRFSGRVYCTLQGDDVFLDGLPTNLREEAITQISQRSSEFDGFFVHSQFYRDYIARYLRLDRSKFQQLPLSIDPAGHDGQPGAREGQAFTVGYFARIAPEKGLRNLVQAFLLLHQRRPEARLKVGGYLGPQQRGYFNSVRELARPLGTAFEYVGSPATLADKVAFYRSVDVLSVPTDFLEPKGLYVLEALANGVPVVQPAHGAFPELLEATGGGLLVQPGDSAALATALERLCDDAPLRHALGTTGQFAVREKFSLAALADATQRAIADQSW